MKNTQTQATLSVAKMPLGKPVLGWLCGLGIKSLGTAVFLTAIIWEATKYGVEFASFIAMLSSLVTMSFLLIGGHLSDALRPRKMMLLASVFLSVILAVGMIWSVASGGNEIQLVVLTVATGLYGAVSAPAAATLTRELTSIQAFPRALSIEQSLNQLTQVVGRPFGGLLVGIGGFALASGVNILTVAAIIVSLLVIPSNPERLNRPKIAFMTALRESVVLASRQPVLRITVLTTGVVAGFLIPFTVLIIPLWARASGESPLTAGVAMGAVAGGALFVTAYASIRGTFNRLGATACIGIFIAAIGMIIFVLSSGVWAFGAAFIVGLGQGIYISHGAPLVRAGVPMDSMGRVQAILALVQSLLMTLCLPLLGMLSKGGNPHPALWTMSFALILIAIIAISTKSFREATLASLEQ